MVTVASLGLVSPGEATDGVPIRYRLLTTLVFPRRLSSVLFEFSHKKIILFGCHPWMVSPGAPPPLPSDATEWSTSLCMHMMYCTNTTYAVYELSAIQNSITC